MRAKPITMFLAKCSCTSKKTPSSTTAMNDVANVVRACASGGTMLSSSGRPARSDPSARCTRGIFPIVLRQVTSAVAGCDARQSESSAARKWATPLSELCVSAPPRCFFGDIFVGDGLDDIRTGDKHVAGLSTMKMKSVSAGE